MLQIKWGKILQIQLFSQYIVIEILDYTYIPVVILKNIFEEI